ncbi:MAG: Cof-type HAD-IIB family hydrolase [Candidatus Humimicrobiaceae bacterium]
MVKLIAIDLDGTLFNSKSKISTENREAIKSCLDKGIKVILSTSKTIYSVGKIIKELGLVDPQMASGGAAIINKDLEPLFTLKVPPNIVGEVIDLSRKYKKGLALSSADGNIYYESKHPGIEHIASTGDRVIRVGSLRERKIMDNILLITLTIDSGDRFNKIIKDNFNGRVKIKRGGPIFLTILNKKAGKLFALKKIMEMVGITKAEIVSIGDSENDLETIKFAGVGIAMANAPESLKRAANYTVSNNDLNGVAEALHKYCLK